METRGLLAAAGGLLLAGGPPAGDANARATDALHRLGYSTLRASLCSRMVPREWICLVSARGEVDRFFWGTSTGPTTAASSSENAEPVGFAP